jgi:hypothetical protein
LDVAIGLLGEHGQLVFVEPVVVEPLAGEVVVDGAVGRFCRCPEGPLDLCEDGVVFREGSEVFGS